MSNFQYANNPQTALTGAVTAGATSITVASGSLFPATGKFPIIVDAEIMLVTGVAGLTWTVTRGSEGTTAAAHNNNAVVTGILTKASLLSAHGHDIRSYGAVDGADSTTAIQAAITAAGSAQPVIIPPGTYLISTALSIGSGAQIVGQGWNSILKRANGFNGTLIQADNDSTDVVLRDFTFDGNKAFCTGPASGVINARRAVRWRVERVRGINSPATVSPIIFVGGTDIIVTGCHFEDSGYGVIFGLDADSTDDMRNNSVQGCTFRNIDLNAIFFTGSVASAASTAIYENCSAIGNLIEGSSDAPIEFGIGGRGGTIANNVIYPTDTYTTGGILVRDCNNIVISGNKVKGATGDGIALQSHYGVQNFIVVTGNSLTANGRHGLFSNATVGLTVVGGDFSGNSQCGIALADTHDFVLSGVTAATNGLSGIVVGDGGASCARGHIVGCTTRDNSATTTTTQDGVQIVGAATTNILIDNLHSYDSRSGGSRTQRYGLNIAQGLEIALGFQLRLTNNISGGINDAVGAKLGNVAKYASAAGPVGAVAYKIPIHDWNGSFMGYLPVYSSIT